MHTRETYKDRQITFAHFKDRVLIDYISSSEEPLYTMLVHHTVSNEIRLQLKDQCTGKVVYYKFPIGILADIVQGSKLIQYVEFSIPVAITQVETMLACKLLAGPQLVKYFEYVCPELPCKCKGCPRRRLCILPRRVHSIGRD